MNTIPPRTTGSYDRRITPARDDLAAASLRGIIEVPRYAEATRLQVVAPSVPMRRASDAALGYDTELLRGELVDVYEITDDWAWGQAVLDGYVGYLPAAALGSMVPATHQVIALRSFLYPGPGIKTTPLGFLPFGARVSVLATEERFARTSDGWLFAAHLGPIEAQTADPVAEAERFLGVPYLWGGKTSLGIDCSGLVQTACHAAGMIAPRDSDMQEKALGEALAIPNDPASYQRGDVLFWPGHVALCQGEGRMIHATAYSMSVISEEIGGALERIAGQGNPLRTVRRLPKA